MVLMTPLRISMHSSTSAAVTVSGGTMRMTSPVPAVITIRPLSQHCLQIGPAGCTSTQGMSGSIPSIMCTSLSHNCRCEGASLHICWQRIPAFLAWLHECQAQVCMIRDKQLLDAASAQCAAACPSPCGLELDGHGAKYRMQ